jgi:cell division protease FtsH
MVEFLRAPARYARVGARAPRGVLLVGPPGTGKTLLARAVAGEANVPFFSICGSEFVEMFVGVGAARVRDLFAQAREKPSSIIFVDELDAVGKARGYSGGIGGHDEREQTLNQLLTEMDGFDSGGAEGARPASRGGVVVIAATNRPEVLDTALLRAGRFDRRVVVDRPDLAERRQILEVHARRVALADGIDVADVAAQTAGLVGADLKNLVNEAALLAARRGAEKVWRNDLDEAIERIACGVERKSRRLGAREKLVVAYHEAGHALMAELCPTQDPVRKISIIPRGVGALGYTMQEPREDRFLMSRNEIKDRLIVLLGGRVAEELVVGDVSTGAQDDLLNATDLARRMVRELGMSDSLGLLTFEPRRLAYGERSAPAGGGDCSDRTARVVDAEVARILGEAQARTRALMTEHRETLERIARRLLEVETLTGDDLRELIAEHVPSPSPT